MSWRHFTIFFTFLFFISFSTTPTSLLATASIGLIIDLSFPDVKVGLKFLRSDRQISPLLTSGKNGNLAGLSNLV